MDTKNRKKKYRLQGAETTHLMQRLGAHDEAGIAELKKLAGRIETINASKQAMSLDKRAGFIFEEVHAGTFNAAARKAGDFKTTALTGNTGGFASDPRVDIRVVRDGRIVAEAQAKCCRSAARSAVSSAKPKYAGTQRIVPDDQASTVRDMLSKSAKAKATSPNPRMRKIGANRQEAVAKVTGKLKAAGHESKAVTHKQAQTLASGDMSSITRAIAMETVKSAATNAAKSGLAVSAATCLGKVANGQISVKYAAKAVVADGAVGAARSAATAVAAEGVKEVAKRALSASVARAFVAGSGPLAIAGYAAELVTDAYKGELTAEKATRSATRAAGGWAGAEGGALVGSMFGPVGTIIGATLGGIGGSWLGGVW